MINICICDDTRMQLNFTTDLIKKYIEERQLSNIEITQYTSSVDLWKEIEKGKWFDIYILDIIMPEMDGIDLGVKIRELDSQSAIIYLTSSPYYAVQSYKVEAFYYILKPVLEHELFKVLDRLFEHLKKDSDKLPVKVGRQIIPINVNSLEYVEIKGHNLIYHMISGENYKSATLRDPFDIAAKAILDNSKFLKINASFAINMDHVKSMNNGNFLMMSEIELPFSRNNANIIKRTYVEYLLKK